MVDIQLLRKAELFSILLDEDLEYIASRSVEKVIYADRIVFHRGAAAIHFYIVKSGEISIIQHTDNEKTIALARYVTGDSFGEFDFITHSLYDVEARTTKKSKLIIFPAFPHTLDHLTNERPDIMTRLYLHSLITLSSRLRSVRTLIAENTTWIKHLQEQLYTDQLTGLYTRLYLEKEVSRLLTPPIAFIVLKPDRFKQLNDIFGHKAGDAVLARIASVIQNAIIDKEKGWGVRLRGNEAVLVLNHTDVDKALEMARSLASSFLSIGPGRIYAVSENEINSKEKKVFRLTATIVIGICKNSKQNWREVLTATYNLMNLIWMKGRNEICVLGAQDNQTTKHKIKVKDSDSGGK
ncbi:MAG: GGDEF domain-containing protein [Spirochaetales bacterium]|nr:GGDEF domain-containing protein [Spirochaetales bacterium]